MMKSFVYVISSWFDKQQMNLIKHNGNTSYTPGPLSVKR